MEHDQTHNAINAQAPTRYPFTFTGSGGEYFKIWIVNILLSIVTLYIYSAWAKVRTKRYFYGNTVLDNSSFEYHAKPKQILIGRLIGVALLIAVTIGGQLNPAIAGVAYLIIFLGLPWVIWRSLKFNSNMSSYRNIRFGFNGKLAPMYGVLVLLPALIIAAVALLGYLVSKLGNPALMSAVVIIGFVLFYGSAPWIHKLLSSYSLNNHRFGTTPFSAKLSTAKFYWIYLKSIGVAIALLIPAAVIASALAWQSGIFNRLVDMETLRENPQEIFQNPIVIASFIAGYLLLFAVGILAKAFFQSRLRNYRYQQTVLGADFDLQSSVRFVPLGWILFTNIVLLIITLGLAYPWIKVRLARYFANNTHVLANQSLDQFMADEQDRISAMGEELGDAFDMDFDVGL